MPLSRAGIHELEPAPDDLLHRLNPQVMVVVCQCNHPDNIAKGQARVRYLKTLLPHTKIGVRWYCGMHGDDKQSTRMLPSQYAADYFPLHITDTLLMPDNEAEASPDDPMVVRRVVAWWVDVIRRATDAGIALGIGCFPVGNPDYPQYVLLEPMFRAMRDAALKGIVHWWRPNAYFVPSDPSHSFDHSNRHQREGRKVCSNAGLPFPPFFLGEFSPLGNIRDAEHGFRKMGLNGAQAAQLCNEERLNDPYAFYASGKTIAGTGGGQWIGFDNLRNMDGAPETSWWTYMELHSPRVLDDANRKLEQAYIQAARGSMTQSFNYGTRQPAGTITLVNATHVNIRSAPNTSSTVLGQFAGNEVVPFWDTPQNNWWQVEVSGRMAYVSDTYINITAAPVDPHPPVFLPELEFDLNGQISKAELASWLRAVGDVIEFGVLENVA